MTNPHPIVTVSRVADHVSSIELRRPPHNFFSLEMIAAIADEIERLDSDDSCRAVVLCAEGKNFCAGADFAGSWTSYTTADLYAAALRLFRTRKPIVAVVQGAAIGGGLGLALAADFRVTAPEARFSANFARLGFHQGFGLSVTLPALIGQQHAAELLYTGRRIDGAEALRIGLADRLVPLDGVMAEAVAMAAEIAASAPLAVESIRATLRGDLADRVAAATEREASEQHRLRSTNDFFEGGRAMTERRLPRFSRN